MDATNQLTPQAAMFQFLSGQILSRSIGLAADLAIADHLSEGPQTIEYLAEKSNSNEDALYRVMRMLAGFGIFAELPGKKFQNTPLSSTLKTNVPGSVRHFARWFSDPLRWRMLGNLYYSVRTGNSAMLQGNEDKEVFELFQQYPESVDTFNKAMTSVSKGDGRVIAQSYDFSPYHKIVDVGGGHGLLAANIAETTPGVELVVYDLPHVVNDRASSQVDTGKFNGRIQFAGGSYLEGVPGPADLYIMKNIIHGEPDDRAVTLLTNCRTKLNERGKVVVVESVITDGPEGNGARIMDIEMMYGPGGRQRTLEEHKKLFDRAGLKYLRSIPLMTGAMMLEAETK